MLNANGVTNNEFLEYKGRPLVRQGEEFYYGDLSEEFHVYMMVIAEKDAKVGDVSVPDTIMVQLRKKGVTMPQKQTIAHSLADALDTADAWLKRNNK